MSESDLRTVAYPRLDEAQIAELERCIKGSLRRYRDGQTLFQVGDRDFKFFVIKNADDHSTYYGGGAKGYTDYPTLAQERGEQPKSCVDERWR